MASAEMVQIHRSWIFSPETRSSSSELLSLNAALNSPAEGPVPSAKAPTMEDLNQLNLKLREVQLSSVEELKEDGFAAHNLYVTRSCKLCVLTRCSFSKDEAVPLFVDLTNMPFRSFQDTSSDKAENISSSTVDRMNTAVSSVPEPQRGGGVRLFAEIEYDCEAYFQPFYDESSVEASTTLSTTVDGKAHGSGDDDAVREVPVFQRDGWDPMGHDLSADIDLGLYLHSDTSSDFPTKRTSRL